MRSLPQEATPAPCGQSGHRPPHKSCRNHEISMKSASSGRARALDGCPSGALCTLAAVSVRKLACRTASVRRAASGIRNRHHGHLAPAFAGATALGLPSDVAMAPSSCALTTRRAAGFPKACSIAGRRSSDAMCRRTVPAARRVVASIRSRSKRCSARLSLPTAIAAGAGTSSAPPARRRWRRCSRCATARRRRPVRWSLAATAANRSRCTGATRTPRMPRAERSASVGHLS